MKSSKNVIKFETVEQLVTYVENLRYASDKYRLSHSATDEWVDEIAGKKYWDERGSIPYVSFPGSSGTEEEKNAYKEYQKKLEEIESRMPEQKKVHTYSLVTAHYSTAFYLSEELYNLLDGVWTKGPTYRGSSHLENKGYLSLPGMLKRLGRTDVADKIKKAKEAEKLAGEKRARNYNRRQIREAAEKLAALLADKSNIILFSEQFMTMQEVAAFALVASRLPKIIEKMTIEE